MKKRYIPPEFEYVILTTPDCLTNSGEAWTGPDYPEPGDGGSTDIGGQIGGGDGGWWDP